jgi:hypothetical protein
MAQRSRHRQGSTFQPLPRALRVRPRGLVYGLPPPVVRTRNVVRPFRSKYTLSGQFTMTSVTSGFLKSLNP